MKTLRDLICRARILLDDQPEQATIGENITLLEEAAEAQDESNLLWSTCELIDYANEAMDEIAIRTRCIRDRSITPGLTAFEIEPDDDPWQPLDARILRILRVMWHGKALHPASEMELDGISDWQTRKGCPAHFIVSQADRAIRPYPTPRVAGTLHIHVVRQPVAAMEDMDDEPEIPPHLLPGAIHWMLHKAYQKNDADTKDPEQSERFLTLFERKFGPRPTQSMLEFQMRTLGVTRRSRKEWF